VSLLNNLNPLRALSLKKTHPQSDSRTETVSKKTPQPAQKKTDSRTETASVPKNPQPASRNETASVKTSSEPSNTTDTISFEGHQQAQEAILSVLAENEIIPHKDKIIDLTAKRPVGHHTHNLFVKDTKKELYLVSHLQSVHADLKEIEKKKIKSKTLRLAPPGDVKSVFGLEKGCITSLSLLNDKSSKVKSIMDKKLLNLEKLTICSGCENPTDHSQHNVVDIAPTLLLKLLEGTGHKPLFIDFE